MVAMQSVWHYLIGIRYQHAAVSYAWYGVCFSRYRYHNLHAYVVLAEKFPIYDPITGRIIRANKEITCGKDVVCANPRWSGSPPNFKTVTPVVKDTADSSSWLRCDTVRRQQPGLLDGSLSHRHAHDGWNGCDVQGRSFRYGISSTTSNISDV